MSDTVSLAIVGIDIASLECHAMGRLKVACFVSLDGVTENPHIVSGGYFDDECKSFAHQQLTRSEYFLMGRVTYELFVSQWPSIVNDPYIGHINGMKKLLASRTLRAATWNTRLLGSNVAEELAEVKRHAAGDIVKYGIGDLDRTLVANGLVDEYHVWIIPRAVGDGKRAFADVDRSLLNLKLLDARRFGNGVMLLSYATH